MTAVSRVVQFAAEVQYGSIPPDAIAIAKTAFLDALGTAVLGSREDCGRYTAQLVSDEESKQESTLFGQRAKSSAANAALVNGTAAHSMDYDHSFGLMGQPTSPIVPAVTSLGEAVGAGGRELLEAYVAGAEVAARLAIAARDTSERKPGLTGWHSNGTFGGLGAAVACARLLRLDTSQTSMAIGIAASMVGSLGANFGTMTKPLHVGLAARNGVTAAKLARTGFTSNPDSFLHFLSPTADDLMETLGKRYEVIETGIRVKPYPCGGVTHEALDSLLAVRKQHAIEPGQIESIQVDVTHSAYNLPFNGVVPETGLQGKFCTPYILSRAAVDGEVSPHAFTDEAVREEAVIAMMKRLDLRLDPVFEATADKRPARATVRLKSGESYTHEVAHPKGGRGTPMTAAEMRDKFMGCARGVLDGSVAARAIESIEQVEMLDDVRPLCELLSGNN